MIVISESQLRLICLLAICWSLVFNAQRAQGETLVPSPARELTSESRGELVEVLHRALTSESGVLKVRVAQYLLNLGYSQQVRTIFEAEAQSHAQTSGYRIGIWHVLARCSNTPAGRHAQIEKIAAVARDAQAEDRLLAVQALEQLGDPSDANTAHLIQSWTEEARESNPASTHWQLLQSPDALLQAAQQATEHQPLDQEEQLAAAHVMAAGWKHAHQSPDHVDHHAMIQRLKSELQQRSASSPAIAQVYADALADMGQAKDTPWLHQQLYQADIALQVSVAHALLRIDRRQMRVMSPLDWWVITLYFLSMLGIGVYYARRNKSAEDFLLGGREMKPWTVGLSLFATLLSTLTYLSVPGEIIRHGPIIVMGIASFPLIIWVVNWYIIPPFMQRNLTSAYEILEIRFGYPGRLCGSLLFLLLRFFWMAVILYATTDKVLVPLLGWPPETTPWLCAGLGILTVIYSSMGGLRAVVATDVIQTFILVGSAVLTLIVITVSLGGIGAWWPTQWNPQWTPLRWLDISSDRNVLMAVIGSATWYICTAGSDQMAIQRYLATSSIKKARRMFNITLLMSIVSSALLTAIGFALLGYFQANPHMLAENMTTTTHADQLFTRFIAVGLPAGISGLVVAGLLAAAMSSLSSGINSSCAVIDIDFIERWRRADTGKMSPLVQTQIISWSVGAAAITLSMVASFVPGNLLEVVYRVGNLLVAPLFILFFMAMFVKQARWHASFLALVCSTLAAVSVAYGQVIAGALLHWLPGMPLLAWPFTMLGGLGILWILPLSMVTGMVTGLLITGIQVVITTSAPEKQR